MNLLFIGDIVGKPGRRMLSRLFTELAGEFESDLVVANAENAAGGFGMSSKIYQQLTGMGVDVLTTGNHVWDRKEFVKEIEECERVIRPANFPPMAPGKGWIILETEKGPVAVINLAGRIFMPPADCPFRSADAILEEIDPDVKVLLVDFHAEATSEKEALGYYLDGRVTAVVGTHTHVPTTDCKVLTKGTAYISDVGMTGPRDSVIGMKLDPVMDRFLTGIPKKFDLATGAIELNAVLVKCDPESGKAQSITRVHRELEPG